jgi:hypothetical protein
MWIETKLRIIRLYNTLRNIVLFRLNGVLTSISLALESDTLDRLRMQYGNWYNLQLMRKFIECDYYLKNRRIILLLKNMETLGRIVIAKVYYKGMTKVELNLYLKNAIGNFMPNTIPSLQVSDIDNNHAKVIFSI